MVNKAPEWGWGHLIYIIWEVCHMLISGSNKPWDQHHSKLAPWNQQVVVRNYAGHVPDDKISMIRVFNKHWNRQQCSVQLGSYLNQYVAPRTTNELDTSDLKWGIIYLFSFWHISMTSTVWKDHFSVLCYVQQALKLTTGLFHFDHWNLQLALLQIYFK